MNKLMSIVLFSVLVWGCAKKMTPPKIPVPPANTGNLGYNPAPSSGNMTYTDTASGGLQGTKALPPLDLSTKSPEERSAIEGQKTYNAKCGKCHAYKVTTDYTRDRWLSIMQVEATRCNLSETEKANVTAYVTMNSKH